MKYQFIEDHRHSYGVALLCEVLQVSRSSYYNWRPKKPSFREIWRLDLIAKIIEIYQKYKGVYGAPRIYDELKGLGYKVSQNTVAKLMARHNLVGVHKKSFKVTTDSDHDQPIYPNLLQQNLV